MARTTRVAVGDWPRLTRFYGLSPFELARMPRWLTEFYAKCLPSIQAEEMLLSFTVSDFPHSKESDRARIRRMLQREADSEPQAPKIDISTEGGRAALAGMGIGIDFTPETPDA